MKLSEVHAQAIRYFLHQDCDLSVAAREYLKLLVANNGNTSLANIMTLEGHNETVEDDRTPEQQEWDYMRVMTDSMDLHSKAHTLFFLILQRFELRGIKAIWDKGGKYPEKIAAMFDRCNNSPEELIEYLGL